MPVAQAAPQAQLRVRGPAHLQPLQLISMHFALLLKAVTGNTVRYQAACVNVFANLLQN